MNKIYIFQCMGKIFCEEFQRVPLIFHPKYLTRTLKDVIFMQSWNFKARYGGSNMKKINNGGRLLIFYMMEGIKKVNWKNGILWLFSVTDPPKIQDGRQI